MGKQLIRSAHLMIAFGVLILLLMTHSGAHVPIYKPPYVPKSNAPVQNITPPTALWNQPPPLLTPGATTPSPSNVQKGSKTVTNKTATPMGWEYWWARNRFQYLDFPKISNSLIKRYPRTGDLKNEPPTQAALKHLRTQSIQAFRPHLKSKYARLRRASAISLARLNDVDSLDQIKGLLKDNNQTVRDSALLALGVMENMNAKLPLLNIAKATRASFRTLDNSKAPDYFRGFAQIALAISDFRGTSAILKSLVNDPKSPDPVKAMALEGLGIIGGEENAKFLIDYVQNSTKASAHLISSAVVALSKAGACFSVPLLEQKLLAKETVIRQSATLGLGNLAAPSCPMAVKKLKLCFKRAADPVLKGYALISIGRVGGADAIKFLSDVISRSGGKERSWACLGLALALRENPDTKHESRLIKLLRTESNHSVRGALAISLGLIKSKGAIKELLRLLNKGNNPKLKGYCAMALGMIQDPSAKEMLRKKLSREKNPLILTQTTMALALLNDTSSIPQLMNNLIESEEDVTKGLTAFSLAFLGNVQIVELALKELKNKHNDVTLSHLMHLCSRTLSGKPEPFLDKLAKGSNFASEYPIITYLLNFGV